MEEVIKYIILGSLLLTSIIGLAIIIERGFALRFGAIIPPSVEDALEACQAEEDWPALQRICEQNPSPLSRLLLQAGRRRDWPKAENVAALETTARHEVSLMERRLVMLEIIVGIAPLLGLVGTIYGLIELFGGLDEAGMGDNSGVAKGIALALRATMLGLVTAIPSLMAWSYYNKKVENLAVEMASRCDQFLIRQYHPAREKRNEDRNHPAQSLTAMQFLVRKRRQTPTIIIISLIDVLLVVLIFLVVTTTAKQQPSVRLALPPSKRPKSGAVADTIIVTIPKEGPLYLKTDPVTVDSLQQRLANALRDNPKTALAIRADEDAPWGRIVKVVEAAEAANIPVSSVYVKAAQ